MGAYQRLIFPLLRRLDPETAHDATVRLLALAGRAAAGRAVLRAIAGPAPGQTVRAFGLCFANVLGVAAGFDKNGRALAGLGLLGFGHVEVGTLTPRPQPGNPRPRLFRLPADQALINRLGFPNDGVSRVAARLARVQELRDRPVVGVSLGKQKETPLAGAAADYVAVMAAVYPVADYLAVNVSSPNTPGLRDLQGGRYLDRLLAALSAENQRLAAEHGRAPRPLLLKIAPDLSRAALDEILATALDRGVAGVIATNTTLSRAGLADPRRAEAGGLSGRPLARPSLEIITAITHQTGGRLPVIAAGGVFSPADAQARLDAGAVLVQLYTALVYEGPGLAGRMLRRMAAVGQAAE